VFGNKPSKGNTSTDARKNKATAALHRTVSLLVKLDELMTVTHLVIVIHDGVSLTMNCQRIDT
jgi:hypothetical protein